MDRHDAFVRHEDEATKAIIPYNLRRLFKIRDPYPVLVARNWARDMAGLETCLCLGVLFFLACVKFISGDSGDVASSSEPLVEDDDDFTVAGVGLTSHVALRASSGLEWADVAVAPFAAKGLLLVLEIGAVACACSGACLACCCHVKCGALQEGDVLTTLGWCSGFSALATAASLVFTALCLLYKWERAMDNNEIGGTLLIMSLYGAMAAVLFCLRLSTSYKAFNATTALKEEIVAV